MIEEWKAGGLAEVMHHACAVPLNPNFTEAHRLNIAIAIDRRAMGHCGAWATKLIAKCLHIFALHVQTVWGETVEVCSSHISPCLPWLIGEICPVHFASGFGGRAGVKFQAAALQHRDHHFSTSSGAGCCATAWPAYPATGWLASELWLSWLVM